MADFAINVFTLVSRKGFWVPPLNFTYLEQETGVTWYITCGGTRAYLVRAGEKLSQDLPDQAADSHFMIRRVTSSLLLGGAGLFDYTAAGRLLFRGVHGSVEWDTQLDRPNVEAPTPSAELLDRIYGWLKALSGNTMLRRAADDAYTALSLPHEAAVFVYRGLEWLKTGQKIVWEDLAKDVGVTESEIRRFKKMANVETGVRHASSTGVKLRAIFENYGTWVCGLIDAINAARARLDSSFRPMSPKEVADAVSKAANTEPFD